MGPLNQFTFCRLCLCTSTSLMDIFDEGNIEGLIVKETIEDLLQLKVVRVHGCPWLTCDSCRNKLNDFRRFKINCIESKVAFESRFPQQIVLMPGGVSISTGNTGKPQTLLLLPVSSMPAFMNNASNFKMTPPTLSQVSSPNCNQFFLGSNVSPNCNQFLSSSNASIPGPTNIPVGTFLLPEVSKTNGIMNNASNFRMTPPSLSNISGANCNQSIPGSDAMTHCPTNAQMGMFPPLAVSKANETVNNTSNIWMVLPPSSNISGENCNQSFPSSNVMSPCPANVLTGKPPLSEVSESNDNLLLPKEEPMDLELKPSLIESEASEGNLPSDDYQPSSPVFEDEIEEKDEKNFLLQENYMEPVVAFKEAGGNGNHQAPVDRFGDGLMNKETSDLRDGAENRYIEKEKPPMSAAMREGSFITVSEKENEIQGMTSEGRNHDTIFCKPSPLVSPFDSSLCQAGYSDDDLMHQSSNDSYECCMCFEVFHRPDYFTIHKLTHKNDLRPYKCKVCPHTFRDRKCQVRHIKKHYYVPNRFECNLCHAGFKYHNRLLLHLKKHREKVKRTFACEVCEEVFPTANLRRKHQVRHFRPQHTCPHCDQAYYARSELNEHVKIHETNRTYKCNICGKAFVKLTYLNYHQQLHDAVKRYVCKECGAKFAQYSAYWQHKKRHQDKEKYVCDVCGKGFILNCLLKKHQKGHLSGKKRGGRRPKPKVTGSVEERLKKAVGNESATELNGATKLCGRQGVGTELCGKQEDGVELSGKQEDGVELSGKQGDSIELSDKEGDGTDLSDKEGDGTDLSDKERDDTELSGKVEDSTVLSGERDNRIELTDELDSSKELNSAVEGGSKHDSSSELRPVEVSKGHKKYAAYVNGASECESLKKDGELTGAPELDGPLEGSEVMKVS